MRITAKEGPHAYLGSMLLATAFLILNAAGWTPPLVPDSGTPAPTTDSSSVTPELQSLDAQTMPSWSLANPALEPASASGSLAQLGPTTWIPSARGLLATKPVTLSVYKPDGVLVALRTLQAHETLSWNLLPKGPLLVRASNGATTRIWAR